jgi:DNA-binding PadR family transcriptional regulator
MSDSSRVERHLPLKPVDFLVLLVLERDACHGYGIVQEIEQETEGRIRLVPGNLYSVLRRLLHVGLIREEPSRAAGDDERRRYYAIESLGREVLAAEAARMRHLVHKAETRRILDAGAA